MNDLTVHEGLTAHDLEIVDAVSHAAEKMPRASRRAIRQRLLAHAGGPALQVQRLVFARAATAFTLVTALLGGTTMAAASALPGDLLYGLKQGTEDVTLSMLPAGPMEQRFLFTLAARRGDEADRLIARHADSWTVSHALMRFRSAIALAYGSDEASGTPGSLTTRRHLAERIQTMAASVKAGYDAAVGAHEGVPPRDDDSGTTDGGTVAPSIVPPAVSPNPGSGGSGSSTGPSPSEVPGSGNGVPSGIDAPKSPQGEEAPHAPQGSNESSGTSRGRRP